LPTFRPERATKSLSLFGSENHSGENFLAFEFGTYAISDLGDYNSASRIVCTSSGQMLSSSPWLKVPSK